MECSIDAAYSLKVVFNRKVFAIKFGNHLHLVIFAARFEKKGK
jgi:hypothetical protein